MDSASSHLGLFLKGCIWFLGWLPSLVCSDTSFTLALSVPPKEEQTPEEFWKSYSEKGCGWKKLLEEAEQKKNEKYFYMIPLSVIQEIPDEVWVKLPSRCIHYLIFGLYGTPLLREYVDEASPCALSCEGRCILSDRKKIEEAFSLLFENPAKYEFWLNIWEEAEESLSWNEIFIPPKQTRGNYIKAVFYNFQKIVSKKDFSNMSFFSYLGSSLQKKEGDFIFNKNIPIVKPHISITSSTYEIEGKPGGVRLAIYVEKEEAGYLKGAFEEFRSSLKPEEIDKTFHIENVVVYPKYVRLGCATALLEEIFTIADTAVTHEITLYARRLGAISLYLKNGFKFVPKKRKEWVGDCNMSRSLWSFVTMKK